MSLQDEISKRIKEEIDLDPMQVGYKDCKSDEEITLKLNSGVARSGTNYWTEQTPISRILNGVGEAQNICAKEDIATAKVFVAKVEEII